VSKSLAYTKNRHLVLRKLANEGATLQRNGALEPSWLDRKMSFHNKNFTNTAHDLEVAGLLVFPQRAMYGLSLGKPKLSEAGSALLAKWDAARPLVD
jgi:hypothetical protein